MAKQEVKIGASPSMIPEHLEVSVGWKGEFAGIHELCKTGIREKVENIYSEGQGPGDVGRY